MMTHQQIFIVQVWFHRFNKKKKRVNICERKALHLFILATPLSPVKAACLPKASLAEWTQKRIIWHSKPRGRSLILGLKAIERRGVRRRLFWCWQDFGKTKRSEQSLTLPCRKKTKPIQLPIFIYSSIPQALPLDFLAGLRSLFWWSSYNTGHLTLPKHTLMTQKGIKDINLIHYWHRKCVTFVEKEWVSRRRVYVRAFCLTNKTQVEIDIDLSRYGSTWLNRNRSTITPASSSIGNTTHWAYSLHFTYTQVFRGVVQHVGSTQSRGPVFSLNFMSGSYEHEAV